MVVAVPDGAGAASEVVGRQRVSLTRARGLSGQGIDLHPGDRKAWAESADTINDTLGVSGADETCRARRGYAKGGLSC
ncbi:hypothetical protein TH468_15275 [Thalassospira sp. MCCC 1A03138]|nr:hypothetical protein TH468_15275 [Thalassospira sp. MCCC 1A03138]